MKKRFRPTMFGKMLIMVVSALLLSSALIFFVFEDVGVRAYADIKTDEMLSRVQYIADTTASYFDGSISYFDYNKMLGEGKDIWNGYLYGYRTNGEMFLSPRYAENNDALELCVPYVEQVFSGERINDLNGVVIGIPVTNVFGDIYGAVFLAKPLNEVNSELSGVKSAILFSAFAALIVMLIPAFFMTQSITKPILDMANVAKKMAGGDYKIIADERGTGETALLGNSLNNLSKALYKTITDLTFERNRLRSILNGMSDGLIAFDAESVEIAHNNSAALRFFGSLDENSPLFVQLQEEITKHKADVANVDYTYDTKKNDILLRIAISIIQDENNSRDNVLVLVRDVTEAERYEQSRRDYVANVSHELRTPLASIRGIGDMLNDGLVKTDAEKQRYYGFIVKEAMRLSRLIDDLLELSRLQSGTLAFSIHRADPYDIVYDVAEGLNATANDAGISIELNLPDGLPSVYTNSDRIEQVLLVLMDNAIKHSATEKIIVSATEQADKIIFSVANSGSIDDDDILHLFERFYKADKAHTGTGTGLGLSIAKEVIEILNEKIWVTSKDGIVAFSFTVSTKKPEPNDNA